MGEGIGWRAAVISTVLLAGCAGMLGAGAPSLSALEQVCGTGTDYGADTPAVYSAYLDAYVAYRHGRLTQADYCAFQTSVARRHAQSPTSTTGSGWADFMNDARARALSWRASVDPTLRGG